MNLIERVPEFKSILATRLKPERYIHSLNVADSAAELAKIYGWDSEKAYIAGLLHDITKNETDENQLKIIENSGIILTDVEKINRKLWHSMSAPYYIKTELGIDDEEILSAVRWHTTARAGMTLPDLIVFIADYISAERNYPDVEVMRILAKNDLEKASLFALRFTISNLTANERPISSDSLDFYNELILKRVKI